MQAVILMRDPYPKSKLSLARLRPTDKARYALLRSALENLASVAHDGCCYDSLFELRLSGLICTATDGDDWEYDNDDVLFSFRHNYWVTNSLNHQDDYITPWKIREEGKQCLDLDGVCRS